LRATPASAPSTEKSTRSTFGVSVVISRTCTPIACAPSSGATKVTRAAAAEARRSEARRRAARTDS
jgi:hypothetical protein